MWVAQQRTTGTSSTECCGFLQRARVERPTGALRHGQERAQAVRSLGHSGVQERAFGELVGDSKNQYPMIESLVRVHRQAATVSQKSGADEALERIRGGLTTKIQLLADKLVLPLGYLVTPDRYPTAQTRAFRRFAKRNEQIQNLLPGRNRSQLRLD